MSVLTATANTTPHASDSTNASTLGKARSIQTSIEAETPTHENWKMSATETPMSEDIPSNPQCAVQGHNWKPLGVTGMKICKNYGCGQVEPDDEKK